MSIFALKKGGLKGSVLTPSSQKVLAALASSNNLTVEQTREKTGLSERTLRFALSKLKERGLVSEVILFSDRRKKVFKLKEVQKT